MRRRYAIGLIKHETNTSLPLPTPLASFGKGEGPAFGARVHTRFEGPTTPMAAYLDLARRENADLSVYPYRRLTRPKFPLDPM